MNKDDDESDEDEDDDPGVPIMLFLAVLNRLAAVAATLELEIAELSFDIEAELEGLMMTFDDCVLDDEDGEAGTLDEDVVVVVVVVDVDIMSSSF
jgi:hypothetical protein